MIQHILRHVPHAPGHHHGGGTHGGLRHFVRGFEHGFQQDFSRGFGPRARRGDIKFFVLELLVDGPRHGYEIIRAIEERRGFRPSPGSIYPTLQMLEEGRFVTGADVEGKRVYTVTDAGRELLASRQPARDDEGDERPGAHRLLKASAVKLGAAVMGVRGNDDATLDRVRAILDRARKEIYAILASDEV